MKLVIYLLPVCLLLGLFSPTQAFFRNKSLEEVNCPLAGYVVDHTANHGVDNRICSGALGKKRDLYVYLPPGFDPHQKYPVLFWLHGISADEHQFIEEALPAIDRAMLLGRMPPVIIVIPDGTKRGQGGTFSTHSSFLNTRLGRFEDYLMCDVWNFVMANYPIRPERKAHVIGGVSLGGGSAYHHGIKHRDRFGVVLGIFPPLNVRWLDCRGRYFGNFNPCCWGWRTKICWGHEPVGKFFGIIKVPIRRLVFPLYGRGPKAVQGLSRDNPIEMLINYNIQPHDLSMYVSYGKKDEFNIDAQVESFLFVARDRGLPITVSIDPQGGHNIETAKKFIDPIIDWLAPQLRPYAPPVAPTPPIYMLEQGVIQEGSVFHPAR